MNRKTAGFALLLFGNLFAVPDTFFFYVGLIIGLVGLILVLTSLKSNKE